MTADFSAEERMLVRGQEVHPEQLTSLRGWYPVVIRTERLWWRYFGDKKFTEPFFSDTVCALRHEKRLCMQTSFDVLDELDESLEPTAFVFHISRCGSTLLTQLLASMSECVVLSEPTAIDSFLRQYHAGRYSNKPEQKLRNIVSALGHKRFAEERHLIVKLDSWHIASLPLFRRAFPNTPFLFLYRYPNEVMASHRRQRGRQMVPGMVLSAMPPLDFELPEPGDLDGYCTKMLEYFFNAANRYAKELTFVNYRQLPHIAWDELLDFLGIPATESHLDAMKSRSGLHSKRGGQFSGDPQTGTASHCTPSATLDASYDRLEWLRRKQKLFRSVIA